MDCSSFSITFLFFFVEIIKYIPLIECGNGPLNGHVFDHCGRVL